MEDYVMDGEEQRLIEDLFERLRNFQGDGAKDPDAEALIRDLVRRSPDAPYYLAQTVIVQQQAIDRADARIQELEQAAQRSQGPYSGRGGSFLGGATSRPSVDASRYNDGPRSMGRGAERDPGNAPGPWSSNPQPAAPGRGGGFLATALSTAAGVAGGAFLFDGIRGLFGEGSRANASETKTADQRQDEQQDAQDDAADDRRQAQEDGYQDAMQDMEDDHDDDFGDYDDDMNV
jgi:uncharacterized protein